MPVVAAMGGTGTTGVVAAMGSLAAGRVMAGVPVMADPRVALVIVIRGVHPPAMPFLLPPAARRR